IAFLLHFKWFKLQKLLSSKWLDYIWNLCNRTTLQCSRCLPGWREHASHCFLLSNVEKTWENLSSWTPQTRLRSTQRGSGWRTWLKEGSFFWVSGDKLKYDVVYWRPGKPNNTKADDIICFGKRNYLCETDALILA
uniref:C-type lectin domain-containing protein n=1 Tax=Xiphophorus couchianus TaxID=32473 RepID=A0A3B5M5T8_9TELE